MKIITEPSVYVVGRQTVNDADLNRFLADHGVSWQSDSDVAGEVLTETAGRLCYLSYAKPRPGGNRAYIDHIKQVGHGSVLEHAVWNLIITGISRALSHELVRHRAGVSPSQLSQRYVDESVAEYVAPPDLAEEVRQAATLFRTHWQNPAFDEQECDVLLAIKDLTLAQRVGVLWFRSVAISHATYSDLSNYLATKAELRSLDRTEARKFARQAARSVLPNATETKLFITANGRALRHFLELRASRHADPEIRKLANRMYLTLLVESPNLFLDYERVALPDGTFELTTPYRKV